MFSEKEIKNICQVFDIECEKIGELIDTSIDKDDLRFNYQINDDFFLKIAKNCYMDSMYFNDVNQLIKHYRSIDVYCPNFIMTKSNQLYHTYEKNKQNFTCYVEEKAMYSIGKPKDKGSYTFKKDVLKHVGKLASRYTNINLSRNNSMWSIIELAPMDIDIDEKQENFNSLMACLKDHGYFSLMDKLEEMNKTSREKIERMMKTLPRCVYQGDLNNSNILVNEEGVFKGLIDFNLSGTEVNINCFLNESMYFLTEDDFVRLTGNEIFELLRDTQMTLLSSITEHYDLNEDEKDVLKDYNKIIYTSFWPNTNLMIKVMNDKTYEKKVLDLLEQIYES